MVLAIQTSLRFNCSCCHALLAVMAGRYSQPIKLRSTSSPVWFLVNSWLLISNALLNNRFSPIQLDKKRKRLEKSRLEGRCQVKKSANSSKVAFIFLPFNQINLCLPQVGVYGNRTNRVDGVDGAEDLNISIVNVDRIDRADEADKVEDPDMGIVSANKADRAEDSDTSTANAEKGDRVADSNTSKTSVDRTNGVEDLDLGIASADREDWVEDLTTNIAGANVKENW